MAKKTVLYELFDEEWDDTGTRHGGSIYPWRDMKVGQCFIVSASKLNTCGANYSPTPPPSMVANGFKTRTKKQDDGSQKVYRVA